MTLQKNSLLLVKNDCTYRNVPLYSLDPKLIFNLEVDLHQAEMLGNFFILSSHSQRYQSVLTLKSIKVRFQSDWFYFLPVTGSVCLEKLVGVIFLRY